MLAHKTRGLEFAKNLLRASADAVVVDIHSFENAFRIPLGTSRYFVSIHSVALTMTSTLQ
jgi:hypothetical protein